MASSDPVMDALRALGASLSRQSDNWYHDIVLATALVAIGVAMEIWAEGLNFRDKLRKGKKISCRELVAFCGAILVVLAVAAEGVAEYKGAGIETALRDNNAATQGVLNDRANKATADAVAIANSFGGLHALAMAAITQSNADLAKITALLNQESGIHARIEKLATPRTLGPDRQQFVTAATAPFKGQRYRASISQGADDGVAFWESLYAALVKAGWEYLPVGPPSVGRPPAGIPIAAIPGVEIRFDPAKESQLEPAALALGNAIHANGTVVAVNRDPALHSNQMEQDVLVISIGVRVPPP